MYYSQFENISKDGLNSKLYRVKRSIRELEYLKKSSRKQHRKINKRITNMEEGRLKDVL